MIVTNPSVDSGLISEETVEVSTMEPIVETETLTVGEEGEQNNSTSNCVSPASSQGGIYSVHFIYLFINKT